MVTITRVQNRPDSNFGITKRSHVANDLNFGCSEKNPDTSHPSSSSIFWAERLVCWHSWSFFLEVNQTRWSARMSVVQQNQGSHIRPWMDRKNYRSGNFPDRSGDRHQSSIEDSLRMSLQIGGNGSHGGGPSDGHRKMCQVVHFSQKIVAATSSEKPRFLITKANLSPRLTLGDCEELIGNHLEQVAP